MTRLNMCFVYCHASAVRNRRGAAGARVLLALGAMGLLAAAGWAGVWLLTSDHEVIAPVVTPAVRAPYVHDLQAVGVAESSNNIEIECEVEWHDGWWPVILEVVEEGQFVEEGDVLIRLETSKLEDLIRRESGNCEQCDAAVVRAQNRYNLTKLELEEYRDGLFIVEATKSDAKVAEAKYNLYDAERDLELSQSLFERAYITVNQLEAKRYAMRSAANDLAAADIGSSVLKRYTRDKKIKELEGELAAAESYLATRERIARIGHDRLKELEEELARCVIRAPGPGYVILAHLHHHGHSHWVRIGEKVQPGRTLIRLPDPKQMQVVVEIEESRISLVEEGQSATMCFDALQGIELTGSVVDVAEFPKEADSYADQTKKYEVTVRIDPESVDRTGAALRPGMSAATTLHIDSDGPSVQIPVQALFDHGGEKYCLTFDQGRLEAKQLKLGESNGNRVVVRDGLEPGSNVVMAAKLYLDRVDLPATDGETTNDALAAFSDWPAVLARREAIAEHKAMIAAQRRPAINTFVRYGEPSPPTN